MPVVVDAMARDLAADPAQNAPAQRRGRHQQMLVPILAAAAGEHVEQRRRVGADAGMAREEAEIRVRVPAVVARADVHVPAEPPSFAPDHERNLRVGLEADHPVADVRAGPFQHLRPIDVIFFVAPRLQLEDHRDLLAAVDRLQQGLHQR